MIRQTAGKSWLIRNVPAFIFASIVLALPAWVQAGQKKTAGYRSPLALAVSPDGHTAYVSDHTAGNVTVLDLQKNSKQGEIPVGEQPTGLALSRDGKTLFVAERLAHKVAMIDTASRKVIDRVAVGYWPSAVAVADKAQRLYVCNQGVHTVSVVDLSQSPPKEIQQIPVRREPVCAALTPDEKHLVVANLLPEGVSTDPTLSAEVSLIDCVSLKVASNIKLPPGSVEVRGACVSPDGKWAYIVHGLGRFNLPITQLERGWVNTYALSVIDIAAGTRVVTMLLDDLSQGAANPHTVVCSGDGSRLWISHTGVHEVSTVEIGKVHELLTGKVPKPLADLRDGTRPNIWVRIQQDRAIMQELENDLTALYIAGAIRRVPSGGNGPKGLALTPDGARLLAANYYSGTVAVFDTETEKQVATISLGPQKKPDSVRRGELLFHDATLAFQRWHSCASCHPDQGRADGLRWDFLRDGIGNPKDTPSLVFLDKTAPLNRRATRKTARECARTGITAGHMIVPTEQQVDDVLAYLVSLRPEPSPFLTSDGKLTEAAQRGKVLFEGKAHCAGCHPAPYYTDKKMHNVGVLSPNEPDGRYDTPALIEAFRTAPYLHDGRARTLEDVLTDHDPEGTHGKVKGLTKKEIQDLVAYLRSL